MHSEIADERASINGLNFPSMTENTEIDLKRSFPVSVSNDSLLELVEQIARKEGFQISKRTNDSVSLSRQPGSFMSYLTNSTCIFVKAQVSLHSVDDYKLLLITGPRASAVRRLFGHIEGAIHELSHFWTAQLNDTLDISSPEQTESSHSSVKADTAAYLYFFKMLVNTKYSLAQDCEQFFAEILDQSAEDSADAATLVTISRALITQHKFLAKKIVDSFATVKHPSSFLSEVLLPRAEFAAEKFVLNKVGYVVFKKYLQVFEHESRVFVQKAEILSNTDVKVWSGIRDEYLRFSFDMAISYLNRLGQEIANYMNTFILLEKIIEFVNILKICVLEESCGDVELVAMDDLAPAFLYVIVKAREFHPVAVPAARAACDALDEATRLSSEGRAMALLDGALRIIINDTYFTTTNS
jgi:hypothetical protein